jgi:hypothetical protein
MGEKGFPDADRTDDREGFDGPEEACMVNCVRRRRITGGRGGRFPVQPVVQCGAATMANVAPLATESLYVSESEGLPRVRIPLSPPDCNSLGWASCGGSTMNRGWNSTVTKATRSPSWVVRLC